MPKRPPTIDRRDPGDLRRNPERGVEITPLPPHCHESFRTLVDGLRRHAQSHKSTWIFAHKDMPIAYVQERITYWKNVLSYLNTLEYLGTTGHGAPTSHRSNRNIRRRTR